MNAAAEPDGCMNGPFTEPQPRSGMLLHLGAVTVPRQEEDMRTTRIPGLCLALAAAALFPAGALAEDDDRAATPEEEEQIRTALEAQGYSGVVDIEVDDGRFELDAISPEGRSVDLELDLSTLEVLHETEDEDED